MSMIFQARILGRVRSGSHRTPTFFDRTPLFMIEPPVEDVEPTTSRWNSNPPYFCIDAKLATNDFEVRRTDYPPSNW